MKTIELAKNLYCTKNEVFRSSVYDNKSLCFSRLLKKCLTVNFIFCAVFLIWIRFIIFFLEKCNIYEHFRPATSLKKRLCHSCFPVNFAKFLRTPYLTEHLWWLLLTFLFVYFKDLIFWVLSGSGGSFFIEIFNMTKYD